jgi:hypothetical protein
MKPTTYCYIFVRYFVEKIILFVFIRIIVQLKLFPSRYVVVWICWVLLHCRLRTTKRKYDWFIRTNFRSQLNSRKIEKFSSALVSFTPTTPLRCAKILLNCGPYLQKVFFSIVWWLLRKTIAAFFTVFELLPLSFNN